MTRRLDCRVAGIEDVARDVRVVLLDAAGRRFPFRAGQYASLGFGDLPPRDYSMANPPHRAPLEFHVRRMGAEGVSDYVARALRPGQRVTVEGPYGDAWLRRDHAGPILAVAGGSGLAPIKSIVETAIRSGTTRAIHLYFGVRDEPDIYLEDHFQSLARAHPNVRFVPVLSDPAGPTGRRSGTVADAVAGDFEGFGGFKAYLAGPPAMVEAAEQVLSARGLDPGDIHADPFFLEAEKAAPGLP